MISIVVDASMTAAWCFEDEQTVQAQELLRRSVDVAFLVPSIWPVEMTNVLLVNERRGRITPADTVRFVTLFEELSIEVDRPGAMQPFVATLSLGRTHKLSAYDASYLELALRRGAPLATLDEKMKAAAVNAGVALV